ncbi:hypothetical protein JCM3765_000152 [Sporobolomyces pararoseus]
MEEQFNFHPHLYRDRYHPEIVFNPSNQQHAHQSEAQQAAAQDRSLLNQMNYFDFNQAAREVYDGEFHGQETIHSTLPQQFHDPAQGWDSSGYTPDNQNQHSLLFPPPSSPSLAFHQDQYFPNSSSLHPHLGFEGIPPDRNNIHFPDSRQAPLSQAHAPRSFAPHQQFHFDVGLTDPHLLTHPFQSRSQNFSSSTPHSFQQANTCFSPPNSMEHRPSGPQRLSDKQRDFAMNLVAQQREMTEGRKYEELYGRPKADSTVRLHGGIRSDSRHGRGNSVPSGQGNMGEDHFQTRNQVAQHYPSNSTRLTFPSTFQAQEHSSSNVWTPVPRTDPLPPHIYPAAAPQYGQMRLPPQNQQNPFYTTDPSQLSPAQRVLPSRYDPQYSPPPPQPCSLSADDRKKLWEKVRKQQQNEAKEAKERRAATQRRYDEARKRRKEAMKGRPLKPKPAPQ